MNPVSSAWTYLVTFIVLLLLLATTIILSRLPLGPFATVTALVIAAIKAVIVALFFMHLRHERGIVRVFACIGAVWLVLLVGITLSDYLSRDWLAAR